MDECKELLEALKANQEKTNELLTALVVLLGGQVNG